MLIPLRLPLFHFFYAGKYIESSSLIPLFALETMFWSAALGPAILLRAMESPRSLFIANAAASVIALVTPAFRRRATSAYREYLEHDSGELPVYVVAYILLGRKLATVQVPGTDLQASLYAD